MSETVSLDLIARLVQRVLDDQSAMRDDMTVLLGRIDHVERSVGRRLDNIEDSLKQLGIELRAIRARQDRADDRLRRVTEAP